MQTETASDSVPFQREGFERWLAAREEPRWLLEQRREAWQAFEQSSWPDRRQEEWMRSDLRPFKLDRYSLPMTAVATDRSTALADEGIPRWLEEGIDAAGTLHTLDGVTVYRQLDAATENQGVIFGDLSQLAAEQEAIVREYLHRIVDWQQNRFAQLHAAVWSGGHFLYVPRGVHVERPFHLVAGLTDGATDSGHTLVVIDEGAEATLLYESSSSHEQAGGLHLGGLEIVVRPGGHLRYVNLQDWGQEVWHFAHQRAVLDRDASIQWTVSALGSLFAQVSQQVALIGPGAHSQVNGVLFTQGRQQLTYNTLQQHVAAGCRSDFLYKAALQDRSRTVWRGMIRVEPGAQKTDGYQRNDNLMLSDHVRADSIPGLEILADDVRCTHGSTTGSVDEEQIFYAQSRGFTRNEATRMIVTGFFQQIFDRITIDSVREALGTSIARQVREYA